MNITVLHKQLQAAGADAIILSLTENTTQLTGPAASVDTALGSLDGMPGEGAISRLLQLGDFSGKLNETAVLYTNGQIPSPRVILVGLGNAEDVDAERIRQASGTALRKARDLGCKRVASMAHGLGLHDTGAGIAAQATIEGALMGLYRFREFKSTGADRAVEQLALVTPDAGLVHDMTLGASAGECVANATNTSRMLVHRPANVMTPSALADFAAEMAGRAGLTCAVLGEREIAEHNMGGLLAVSQGSAHSPRFVVLEAEVDSTSGSAARFHRQRRHIRFGRAEPERAAGHGEHEGRHEWRGGRGRRDAGHCRTQVAPAGDWVVAVGGEHA